MCVAYVTADDTAFITDAGSVAGPSGSIRPVLQEIFHGGPI